MIAISTSRRPTNEFRRIVKLFVWFIPNSIRIGRGHANIQQLAAKSWGQGARRLLVIHEHEKKPRHLQLYDLEPRFRELTGLMKIHHFESRYDTFKERHGKLNVRSMHVFLSPRLSSSVKEIILRFFEPVSRPSLNWGERCLPQLAEKNKKIPKNLVSLEIIPLTQILLRVTFWHVYHRYPLLRMVIGCSTSS